MLASALRIGPQGVVQTSHHCCHQLRPRSGFPQLLFNVGAGSLKSRVPLFHQQPSNSLNLSSSWSEAASLWKARLVQKRFNAHSSSTRSLVALSAATDSVKASSNNAEASQKAHSIVHKQGASHRAPNLNLTDHWFKVPLDYSREDSPSLQLFVREVTSASASATDKLPYLIYLQGGPGFESPRPTEESGWLKKACEKHRVLLLDQRGTGLSSPISASALSKFDSPKKQADFLTHFRQDNIVRDCESVRKALGIAKWTILGQSFGGFCALTYLSLAPEGIHTALITGGLAPVTQGCSAEAVYTALFQQNRKYYTRFPSDAALVRSIVLHLAESPTQSVPLPSGGVLTPRGLQLLGLSGLGSAGGFERLHYLLERAWDAPLAGIFIGNQERKLSYTFLRGFENWLSFDTNPLYAVLHESIYCQGAASKWAAHRVRESKFAAEFDAVQAAREGRPVYFTGEMVFPWMFDELAGLRPVKEVANLLAEKADWGEIYRHDVLKGNKVPVAACAYYEDMYVDFGLSQETASIVQGLRFWVTSEFQHSGIREDGPRVLEKLLALASEQHPLN